MFREKSEQCGLTNNRNNSISFKVLDDDGVAAVSGGISQSTQIASQMAFVGSGIGLYAAGIALAPFGAALFVGTSLALTGSYLYHNWP
ncbi:hypothetical protein [Salinimonas chungwhensis]|uniref:hypothetical protein n=1 Tax=Salinimonas chungwhensis TaxID=265425 RepID=UPI00039CA5E0|nr:hypothetical protein [Salinimonas chungwhensis]